MKPFYQGKIDTFCALYAVLNALRITHGIRSLKARSFFNDMLMELIKDPLLFQSVLEQHTDYVFLVDKMLHHCAKFLPLRIETPFNSDKKISVDQFWDTCSSWMSAGDHRTVILRFMRYLKTDAPPVVRHWTTFDRMDVNSVHLYDSSHEADSIQNLPRKGIVTRTEDISESVLLQVQPSTVRFVGLPF